VNELEAALRQRDALVAQETTAAVVRTTAATYQRAFQGAVQAIQQAAADATVQALREAGLLREGPAERILVRHLIRDGDGLAIASVERYEEPS
jgi:hypothetical protein